MLDIKLLINVKRCAQLSEKKGKDLKVNLRESGATFSPKIKSGKKLLEEINFIKDRHFFLTIKVLILRFLNTTISLVAWIEAIYF